MPPITPNSPSNGNVNRWDSEPPPTVYKPNINDRLDQLERRLDAIGTTMESPRMNSIPRSALDDIRISRDDFLTRFLAKEISEDLLSPFGGANETAKIVGTIFKMDAARQRVTSALREDNARGDSELNLTKRVIKDEISGTLSDAIAASIIKKGLQRNPTAAVVAAVIGPEPIDALIDDGIKITEWGMSSISRDDNGELVFDPDALLENVPELDYARKMGQAGAEFGQELRESGFLERSYKYLDNLGHRTARFFRDIFE